MNTEENDSELEAFERLCSRHRDGLRRGDTTAFETLAQTIEPGLPEPLRSLGPVVARLERAFRSTEMDVFPGAVPETLGPYRLVRELGRGGMGVVFEAHEEGLDRRVAVKVLSGWGLSGGQSRARFLREARAIARLRHPGIVPIHAVGESDGWLYFAMDLIEGASLDELVARADDGSETTAERARWVARVGAQAADALGHAHRQGVIHRDVKPSNFLLDADGRVWLADFGLAKIIGEESITVMGVFLGTLRYLAPEGIQGEADARGDIYSLGLTLYELLLGRPAFPEGEGSRLVTEIVRATPPCPRTIDRTIPEGLERIILKAMAFLPVDRYADAQEMADDLRRFLAGESVRARGPGLATRLVRGVRGNPVLSSLAVLTLVLTAAVVWLLVNGRAGPVVTDRPAPAAAPVPQPAPDSSFERGKGPPPWAQGRSRGQGAGKGGRGMGRVTDK